MILEKLIKDQVFGLGIERQQGDTGHDGRHENGI